MAEFRQNRPHASIENREYPDKGVWKPEFRDFRLQIGKLARQTRMDHYKVVTNSPAEQDVGYLHFHLIKVDPKERKFPFQQKKKEDTTPND